MYFEFCFLSLFLKLSGAVITTLNGTEYDRMPPLYEMDDYEKCLREQQGLYCVVNITLSASPDNDLMRMIREYSELPIHYNHTSVDRGICVTSKCKRFLTDTNGRRDLHNSLETCVKQSFYRKYQLNANLAKIYYCKGSNDKNNFDLGDGIFGSVITLIIAINIISSIYDIYLRNFRDDTGNKYILCFSIIKNVEHLMSHQTSPNFERFAGINGLRTILSFSMVLGHVMFIFGCGFLDNPGDFEAAYHNPLAYIIFNGTLIVQGYFMMSGCLLSYTLALNSQILAKWTLIPIAMFYRWCRLTPALAVLLGFMTTWYRHVGSGPLWDFYVSPVINDCRTHWLSHILYFNNFSIRSNNTCSMHTWHIAADTQMFAIALIILFAFKTYRSRTIGILLLFLVGCVCPALHDWLQDVNGVLIKYPEFYRTYKDDSFRLVYVSFYNSLSCFAIGLQLGLIFHKYRNSSMKFIFPFKRFISVMVWFIVPMFLLVLMSGYAVYPNGERPSLPLRIAYSALHRPMLGVVVAIGFIIVFFNIEDSFRSIFEWSGWRIPSRLTYGVFLVHFSIVQYIQGSRTQLFNFSYFNLMLMHLGVVWLSYLVAIPVYLLVESPISKIVKICLVPERPQLKKKN
ncbi:unnamed protein product [Pieris macdunnoughi]|uniref:Acyltransferase 3 domain-containing protein n=1 Tax=Pieris macdunnoughi TaxID=345717 RepID=A0A821TUJ1_9NEOP|nr:unnamed protein product [Pieris macdunnoughi]